MSTPRIRSKAEPNGTAYYSGDDLVAWHEPGWYTPATDDVWVEIGESIYNSDGFRIPITVRDGQGNAHGFISTGLRGEDGGDSIRLNGRFIIKCPDRPAVGYWRKVEGIQQ